MSPNIKKSTEVSLGRVPPQNLEAEQAVLGGIFNNSSAWFDVYEILDAEDFYSPAHKLIFESMERLQEKHSPIDVVTVKDELDSSGKLDELGGFVYLFELAESVVSGGNAIYHAGIVKKKAIRRKLIHAGCEVISMAFDNPDDDNIAGECERAIFSVSMNHRKSDGGSAGNAVAQAVEAAAERSENKSLVTGVPTGFNDLDLKTSGFQNTDLIILAGRPSMGKTAFALNCALKAAQYEIFTAVFSLEMPLIQIGTRLAAMEAEVDSQRLRDGNLPKEDWHKVFSVQEKMETLPMEIVDKPNLSVAEIMSRCRRFKAENNLGLVVIDYLQLMRLPKGDTQDLRIGEVTKGLKSLAKELNVPVILLSQLNRKVEERTDKRPMMSDLRESGNIEQDADVILFVYRDAVYNKSPDSPLVNTAEINIAKQRNGPTGKIELFFKAFCTRFENMVQPPDHMLRG